MLAQFSHDYVLVGVKINRIFGMFGSGIFFSKFLIVQPRFYWHSLGGVFVAEV